jgi:hypothetical protein
MILFIFVDQKRVIKSVNILNIFREKLMNGNLGEWKQLPLRVGTSILAPTLLLYRILHKARANESSKFLKKISTRLH